MHASLEQLISLRDEEPVTVEVQQHVRGCSHCAKALNGLMAARERLTAVADPLPPADAWDRIATAAEQSARRRRRWLPAAGVSLAASIAAAVLVVNMQFGPAPSAVSSAAVSPNGNPDLGQLMAQSRYLERAVLRMDDHADRMAVSAGTASTIAALEDRIALVDYELGSVAGKKGAEQRVTELWKQRVDLLQSLAAVRYAQVADTGI
jgi:hypothetical protein